MNEEEINPIKKIFFVIILLLILVSLVTVFNYFRDKNNQNTAAQKEVEFLRQEYLKKQNQAKQIGDPVEIKISDKEAEELIQEFESKGIVLKKSTSTPK